MHTGAKLRLCIFWGLFICANITAVEIATVENYDQISIDEDPETFQKLSDQPVFRELSNLALQILPKSLQKQVVIILQENAHLSASDVRRLVLNYFAIRLHPYMHNLKIKTICDFLLTPAWEFATYRLSRSPRVLDLFHDLGLLHGADAEQRIKELQLNVASVLAIPANKEVAGALKSFFYEIRFDGAEAALDATVDSSELFAKDYGVLYFCSFSDEKMLDEFNCALPLEVCRKMVREGWCKNQKQMNIGFAKLLGLEQKNYEQMMLYEIINSTGKFLARSNESDLSLLLALFTELKMLYDCADRLRLEHERNCLLRLKTRLKEKLKDVKTYYADFEGIFRRLLNNLELDPLKWC